MLAPPPLPRNLDACLRDLASKRVETRASAVVDLVRIALRDGIDRARALPLFEKALKDDAPAVRSAAAVALGDLKAKEALSPLLVAIEDDDALVRQMAMNALGEIGDTRALSRLRRALEDARPEVRYQAVIAFARISDHESDVAEVLTRALADKDDAVRYIALRVAEEALDTHREKSQDSESQTAIFEAAAKKLLDDASENVALAAAIYVLKSARAYPRDDDARDRLARDLVLNVIRNARVRRSAPEKEDEGAAVELAGALDLRDAIPDLERRAWGAKRFVTDTCAWQAKIALARMDQARAKSEIMRDLDSMRRETRAAAIVAAGRARIAGARARIASFDATAADPDLVADALRLLDGAAIAPKQT
jgi:hypothetical protein